MAARSIAYKSNNADVTAENADGQPTGPHKDFALRLRAAARENGLTGPDLRRRTGTVKQTFAGYWNGDRLPPSELLFDLADNLDRDPRWLLNGSSSRRAESLVVVDEADWVTIEEYDLRELSDVGKGEGRYPSPFRRDWLNQTLGTASGLWLTRLLSDYPAAGLAAGALVFCLDVEAADLLEGQLCLFRINGGLVAGRFSFRAPGGIMAAGDRLGEVIITSSEIGHEDNQYVPIARILGRFIGRL